jgi:thiol:disulfide interchange protein DsbD
VCIPESADLSLVLPVVGSAPLPDARWVNAFEAAQSALPGNLPGWKADARIENGKAILTLVAPAGTTVAASELSFYPLREEIIANAGRQVFAKTADGLSLSIPMADPVNMALKSLDGVLVSNTAWGTTHPGRAVAISAPVVYGKSATAAATSKSETKATSSGGDDIGLLVALAFAFVGGLFLNLMPCVFPVLGIKVMGFVQHAQGDQRRLKFQGLAFLGGVLISFWILAGLLIALRAGGESVGWGFQLQSPVFVTLLALLFLLMALNLSGVFEMGMRLQSAAGSIHSRQDRGPVVDAFLSGVLATIIATPCTAPFMGAALGYTLSQSAFVSLIVFTFVALGVAAPVVALSMFPGWLKRLPRPGAWMDGFKQFMAFPLYATVVWLVWVLGSQQGNDGTAALLLGMVIVALGAWLYGKWQLEYPVRALVAAFALLILGAAIAWPGAMVDRGVEAAGQAAGKESWVPFSKEKVAKLRGQGRAVFIDFTATWCITCQVNKRVALNDKEVLRRFSELNIVRVKADWTVKDAAITEALAEFGRNGVPLYVFYPATGEAKLLPEILTPAIVLSSLGNPVTVSTSK